MPVALVLSVCSRRDDNLLDIQNYGNALLIDKHDRERVDEAIHEL